MEWHSVCKIGGQFVTLVMYFGPRSASLSFALSASVRYTPPFSVNRFCNKTSQLGYDQTPRYKIKCHNHQSKYQWWTFNESNKWMNDARKKEGWVLWNVNHMQEAFGSAFEVIDVSAFSFQLKVIQLDLFSMQREGGGSSKCWHFIDSKYKWVQKTHTYWTHFATCGFPVSCLYFWWLFRFQWRQSITSLPHPSPNICEKRHHPAETLVLCQCQGVVLCWTVVCLVFLVTPVITALAWVLGSHKMDESI